MVQEAPRKGNHQNKTTKIVHKLDPRIIPIKRNIKTFVASICYQGDWNKRKERRKISKIVERSKPRA